MRAPLVHLSFLKHQNMKHTLITLALCFVSLLSFGQITLEHTYSTVMPGASGQFVLFSSNGTKIMMSDTGTNQVKLYNTDHSLWKTINVPAYSGFRFTNSYLVSDNLFNSDNNIEMIVTYYGAAATYKSVVIAEDGTVLADLGGALFFSTHSVDGHYKLSASTLAAGAYTYDIYSLPGTLPCGLCGNVGVTTPVHNNGGTGTLSDATPNPTTGGALISFTLPYGVSDANISITNAAGQIVQEIPVNGQSGQVHISTDNLSSGIYYYNYSDATINSEVKKLVVSH
jgi:hypothetical protein